MGTLQRLGLIGLTIFMLVAGGSSAYATDLSVRMVTHIALTLTLLVWLIGRIRRGRFLPDDAAELATIRRCGRAGAVSHLQPRHAYVR